MHPPLRRPSLSLGAALLALLPALALPMAGGAQQGEQRVRLELRPQAGDTLRMVVEQQTELTGSVRGAAGAAETSRTVTTVLRLASRAIVLGPQGSGVALLSITDSVAVTSTDAHAQRLSDEMERQMRGRAVRLLIAPDGAARVLDDAPPGGVRAGRALPELVAAMPAAFPARPVAVGERWTREMALPAGRGGWREGAGVGGGSIFRATFRLDSLSRDQTEAYISMRGEIGRDLEARGGAPGGDVEQRGTITGTMLLDRVRGWLADTRTSIVMYTTLLPPKATGAPPMHFVTKIVQRARTLERR